MTRHTTWAIAVLALLAAGTTLIWYQGRGSHLPEGLVWGNGRVEGTELRIAAKYAGRVAEVLVREGDEIAEGQILVKFDARESMAQRAEARAQKLQALHAMHAANAERARRQSELDFLDARLRRIQELSQSGHVSEEQLDSDRAKRGAAAAALDNADALVIQANAAHQAAEARVERTEAVVSESELSAPVPGRVLFRLVEPGEIVPAGGIVMVLVDLDHLYMTIYVPEREAGLVQVGAEAALRLDVYPDRLFEAGVSFVADKAEFTPKEVETREERDKLVFRVKLSATDNKDRLLKPGMPGEAWIRADPKANWPPKLE